MSRSALVTLAIRALSQKELLKARLLGQRVEIRELRLTPEARLKAIPQVGVIGVGTGIISNYVNLDNLGTRPTHYRISSTNDSPRGVEFSGPSFCDWGWDTERREYDLTTYIPLWAVYFYHNIEIDCPQDAFVVLDFIKDMDPNFQELPLPDDTGKYIVPERGSLTKSCHPVKCR